MNLCARARDWSEIQERMLVPLYEAVYERLEVGPATRLLGLACGSGLALLMAASRGAAVTGVESSPERRALARQRLQPDGRPPRARAGTRIVTGSLREAAGAEAFARTPAYTLVTAFDPVASPADGTEDLGALLAAAAPLAGRGGPVVLAGWGPPERCATSAVLRAVSRPARWRPALRDDLEEAAQRAGLKPDGSGRVACPFGYAGLDSAVRGLVSTGLLDGAIAATDEERVTKELAQALHPYRRGDGTVWMPNVFRYLIARVPQGR